MKKKVKILYRGAFNLFNYGDDLLLLANLNLISNISNKTVEAYVVKNFNSINHLQVDNKDVYESIELIDSLKCDVWEFFNNRKYLKPFKYMLVLLSMFFLLLNICIYRSTRKIFFYKDYVNFIRNIEIIHYVGGGYLAERWMRSLSIEIITLFFAKLINPSIIIFGSGLGIGPFKKTINIFILKKFLGYFDQIYVREDQSLRFVKSLKIKIDVKKIGDDVILLFNIFKQLSKRPNDNINRIAINLKDFPEHDYSFFMMNFNKILRNLLNNDYKIAFFSFGQNPGPDDLKLLNYLDSDVRGNLEIYNPYEHGSKAFIENLSKCNFGIGFAYHFNVICALLGIKSLGIYSGEYYKQKISGVMNYLCNKPMVISTAELNALDMEKMLNTINKISVDSSDINTIYEQMKSDYINWFEKVLC